ncbi:MAG: hypothetical protein U1F76_04400 [Candidatus Competibacteraceae bacterium]
MTTLSVRGIDEQTTQLLKQEAEQRGISMNTLILELIRAGISSRFEAIQRPTFSDLDYLAGTWTPEEAAEFIKTQQDFEKIDEELWR